ncbi:MAG: hypothetical protein QOJ29_3562 [Thermoleophilaceae bacterium]|jgi:hypothetical protein|nr:hypothetical protein [Thermoleophilaceae bacterium]
MGPMVLVVVLFAALGWVGVGEYPNPGRRSNIVGSLLIAAIALLVWDLTHWPITPDN